jgi:hypothetical protein
MTTTNLPASIETATRAVVALSNDVDEVTVCLTMAFGLDFIEVPASPEKYGSLSDAISRTAIHLDALAKTAEAASLKLRGATQPVRELPRPEPQPCQCAEPELPEFQVSPAPETLTTPGEAVEEEDGECEPVTEDKIEEPQKTDDGLKAQHDPGESLVVHLPDREQAHQPAREDDGQGRPRRRGLGGDERNRGKASRK